MKIILIVSAGLIIIVFLVIMVVARQRPGKITGLRLDRIKRSENYSAGKFVNSVETGLSFPLFKVMKEYSKNTVERYPNKILPSVLLNSEEITRNSLDDVRITWLGHSTVLIQSGGITILTDPVFGKRASMFSFIGPKAFDYENNIEIKDLPGIDIVLLSHDHYDHLDHFTISQLKDKVKSFYMPLGVGAYLEKWGVHSDKINELDWGEDAEITNEIRFICTPSRHFSGRTIRDRYRTLWCSWIIQIAGSSIFFGGDSGYFGGFREIGEKYGPFDITILECGAYSQYWSDIHMFPEQTARAHIDLDGKLLMPVHWAKFSLSFHAWNEPVERLLASTEEKGISLALPLIGETFLLHSEIPRKKWWKPKQIQNE